MVGFLYALFHREYQIADKDDERHKGGQSDLFKPGGEKSYVYTEKRKRRKYAGNDDLGNTFPDSRIRFAVVFSHYRFQIHRFFDGRNCFFLKQ